MSSCKQSKSTPVEVRTTRELVCPEASLKCLIDGHYSCISNFCILWILVYLAIYDRSNASATHAAWMALTFLA